MGAPKQKKSYGRNDNSDYKNDKKGEKIKKPKRKKTRKDRMKENLQPKSSMVSFTNSFLNEVCKANEIPVLQDRWLFKNDSR